MHRIAPRRAVVRAILVLLGVAVAAGRVAASDADVRVVDYFHESSDGTSYHGTISNLNGEVRSAWTIERGADKRRSEQPISRSQFEALLAGFDAPELQQYEVTRDDQRLDFRAYQVLSVITVGAGRQIKLRRTFLVPMQPKSPRIASWLQQLAVPRARR